MIISLELSQPQDLGQKRKLWDAVYFGLFESLTLDIFLEFMIIPPVC